MKKTYRIKKETEFREIMAQRRSFANRNFIIYINERQKSHKRIGLSVGKKVGNAVVRNYVKRQIRETIFNLETVMSDDYDMIIIARPNVTSLTFLEVNANLEHVFKLANIL